jgi:dolichyl-diphosphooligosaccharide--protein glycosyltransferase
MLVLESRYKKINKWKVRAGVTAACMILAAPVLYYLYNIGYFGPISSRVRGLFVKHTKTGNPLVDSVAEHQAASPEAYYQYLHDASLIAPYGLLIVALLGCTASSSFLIMYGVTAYFFSHKMVRLILLTAPIASICAGIALGYAWAWGIGAIFGDARPNLAFFLDDDEEEEEIGRQSDPSATTPKKKKKGRSTGDQSDPVTEPKPSSGEPSKPDKGDALWTRLVRLGLLGLAIQKIRPNVDAFKQMAEQMARAISHPTIIQKGRTANGQTVVVDDYREAYWWLRDNTPEDARIMAWWDYGYQITGIGNRTTIADGNTWNHEHIALLGRTLTSPEKEAHRIARHLADYVLIWAGGGGDDLAKSPHLRRIANSVYQGLCKEPTCHGFGMMVRSRPSIS